MPVTLAGTGARAAALTLDLAFIVLGLLAVVMLLAGIGIGLGADDLDSAAPAVELILALFIMVGFLSRYGYFLAFELGPRGATPGKRLLGIRVAARPAGGAAARLTAEAVIARNLMRDAELFLPLFWIGGGIMGEMGVAGIAAAVWLLVFALFPLFNRDMLRAGDLVAGTWVIESRRAKLQEALSLGEDRSGEYRFGEAELSVYGERELQVLERVLREDRPQALRQVAETICAKLGWTPGRGDEREFLEAFYAALRARLERDMRFGRRKKDKHS